MVKRSKREQPTKAKEQWFPAAHAASWLTGDAISLETRIILDGVRFWLTGSGGLNTRSDYLGPISKGYEEVL